MACQKAKQRIDDLRGMQLAGTGVVLKVQSEHGSWGSFYYYYYYKLLQIIDAVISF